MVKGTVSVFSKKRREAEKQIEERKRRLKQFDADIIFGNVIYPNDSAVDEYALPFITTRQDIQSFFQRKENDGFFEVFHINSQADLQCKCNHDLRGD